MFGAHVSLDELVADMDRMSDAAGKYDGAPAFAVFEPMRDDIADELVAVHARSELGLVVIALHGLDTAQIRVDRRIDPRLYEMLLHDQLGDLRAFEHHLEDAAEPAPIASARRCR